MVGKRRRAKREQPGDDQRWGARKEILQRARNAKVRGGKWFVGRRGVAQTRVTNARLVHEIWTEDVRVSERDECLDQDEIGARAGKLRWTITECREVEVCLSSRVARGIVFTRKRVIVAQLDIEVGIELVLGVARNR